MTRENRDRRLRKVAKWLWGAFGVLAAIIVIAAIFGGDPEENNSSSDDSAAVAAESEPAPEPKPDPAVELREAIEDPPDVVFEPVVRELTLDPYGLLVLLETPEGGVEGASTRDTNEQARTVFSAAHELGQPKRGRILVKFVGGLVDTTTGQDVPNKLTAEYEMSKAQMRRINWSDEDTVRYVIDWSAYRNFVHPAIKMDD